jgi:hypothetical protein
MANSPCSTIQQTIEGEKILQQVANQEQSTAGSNQTDISEKHWDVRFGSSAAPQDSTIPTAAFGHKQPVR